MQNTFLSILSSSVGFVGICVMRATRQYPYVVLMALCAVVLVAGLFFTPVVTETRYPHAFIVERGETVRSVARRLHEGGHIHSPTLFLIANRLVGDKILYGSYSLLEPKSIFGLAYDFYAGHKNSKLIRIVIPEGTGGKEIAEIFTRRFDNFDSETFRQLALEHHGYLYPDTYFFVPEDITVEQVIATMLETFELRTKQVLSEYEGPLSLHELVTLASIVELEAADSEERKLIAGVLYNRLAEDIPLQVDVSFLFINGKNSFTLSREDLRVDDVSNTYRYAGIPPVPITNPGLDALTAVVHPTDSEFFYFLADKRRKTHFSETYQEHLIKKERYINSQ